MPKQFRQLVAVLILAFVGGSVIYGTINRQSAKTGPYTLGRTLPVVEGVDPVWAVYFFYNDIYCETCERLEGYALEAVQEHFQDDLDSGVLQWRSMDMTLPEYEHYAEDFELYSKSVVLVELDGAEEVRWENLEGIWDLVHDKPVYKTYIESSLTAFMDSAP